MGFRNAPRGRRPIFEVGDGHHGPVAGDVVQLGPGAHEDLRGVVRDARAPPLLRGAVLGRARQFIAWCAFRRFTSTVAIAATPVSTHRDVVADEHTRWRIAWHLLHRDMNTTADHGSHGAAEVQTCHHHLPSIAVTTRADVPGAAVARKPPPRCLGKERDEDFVVGSIR